MATQQSDAYHNEYLAEDFLPDGTKIIIRNIGPQDKPILQEGMHHLSATSRYFRFLGWKDELNAGELSFFTEIDFSKHVALLGIIVEGDLHTPAGVCRYVLLDNGPGTRRRAEIAVVVEEEHQGRGIATLLLKHLTQIARTQGVEEFTGTVHPDNTKVIRLLYNSGLAVTEVVNDAGILDISLNLASPNM